jgi:hypothetical protein
MPKLRPMDICRQTSNDSFWWISPKRAHHPFGGPAYTGICLSHHSEWQVGDASPFLADGSDSGVQVVGNMPLDAAKAFVALAGTEGFDA